MLFRSPTAKVTAGASYGDALMAGIGVGIFKDFAALQPMIRPSVTYAPSEKRHKSYQPYRAVFDKAYLANRELMHLL